MEEKDKYSGTIKAVSKKNYSTGQIGFSFNPDAREWYNITLPQNALDILLKESIVVGNEIEFEVGENGIENLKVLKKAEKKSGNWADDMVNLEKLLDAAHKKGIQKVEIIKRETKFDEKNIPIQSISEIRVTMKDGSIFEGTGDADKNNVTEMTEDAVIRMGETRGLVRALRWATNESKAAEEEKPEQ